MSIASGLLRRMSEDLVLRVFSNFHQVLTIIAGGDGCRDIKIIGHHNRNRAYDGDTVVVRVLTDEDDSDEHIELSGNLLTIAYTS